MLPVKSIPSNPPSERMCRAGCMKRESLSHILQDCPKTHWPRLKRHDWVVKRVAAAAKKNGWRIEVEPRLRLPDGTLKKPDVLCEKGDNVIISDIAIHWEGPEPLNVQFLNKVTLYSSPMLISLLQARFPNKNIYVLPMVVGARGAWCSQNESLVKWLGIRQTTIRDIITTTLRGGWYIHRFFMSNVWS